MQQNIALLFCIQTNLLCLLLCLPGCKQKNEGMPAPEHLPSHTLVFGGDLFLGGGISRAVIDKDSRDAVFGDLGDIIRQADLAIVNGEGVISSGGMFADKDDGYPIYYRAHPDAVQLLTETEINMVNVGNNHSGDYNTDAFVEMLDRLSAANIDYIGGGYNLQDARTPAVRVVGDTGLAVVGADMTSAKSFAATISRPGSLFFPNAHVGNDLDNTATQLEKILMETRKKANVILFTPHWGPNWSTAPTKPLQQLAERLIEAGYDGILGHSAHLPHGVALIQGKPVIYDAGNLLLNYGTRPGDHGEHRSVLYELVFNKAGITEVRANPILLGRNSARLATDETAAHILSMLQKRSADLDTTMHISDGMGIVSCDPGGLFGPKTPKPIRKKRTEPIRAAESHLMIDTLPKEATPLDVLFENGIRLLGFKLRTDKLPLTNAAEIIETYWKIEDRTKALSGNPLNMLVHMEAVQPDAAGGPKKLFSGHQPGDWILPVPEWPKDKVIRDITYFRVTFEGHSKVQFFTGLWTGSKMVPVVSHAPSVVIEDGRVLLGTVSFEKGAPSITHQLARLRADLKAAAVSEKRP